MADEFQLTRAERMCLLTCSIEREPQDEIIPDEGHIVWARDPKAAVDPSNVHVIMRVRLHGELLLSAHGPWQPQEDEISLSSQQSCFTTSEPIFPAPPPSVVEGHEEAPESKVWLQNADQVRARLLGTYFNPNVWGIPAFEEIYNTENCLFSDDPGVLQSDVKLIHVLPASGTRGRRFEYCQLLNHVCGFRTQTDTNDNPLEEIDIRNGKIGWALSSASPFRHELDTGQPGDPDRFEGASVDNIEYGSTALGGWMPEGDWFETNIFVESLATPHGTSHQVHTVQSVSLGIVNSDPHGPMRNIQGRESLNLLPCRQNFTSSIWFA